MEASVPQRPSRWVARASVRPIPPANIVVAGAMVSPLVWTEVEPRPA